MTKVNLLLQPLQKWKKGTDESMFFFEIQFFVCLKNSHAHMRLEDEEKDRFLSSMM